MVTSGTWALSGPELFGPEQQAPRTTASFHRAYTLLAGQIANVLDPLTGAAGLSAVLFCHATPGSDTEIVTRLTPEARLLGTFGGLEAALVVCGHTHMQYDRRIGGVRVVNAGGVGMPFGDPGAYWLLLGHAHLLLGVLLGADAPLQRDDHAVRLEGMTVDRVAPAMILSL